MDTEDLEPRKKPPAPMNLEVMSIDELEAHIADLQAEIARTRAEIEAKRAQRGEADALFRR